MAHIVSLGELLIDFFPIHIEEEGREAYLPMPGGAPANCLSQLVRLGHQATYISCVGEDVFGKMLVQALEDNGIASDHIQRTLKAHTTFAFVSHDEGGDRSFSFYRNPGADLFVRLKSEEKDLLKNCNLFHIGTLSLVEEPAREATFEALSFCKKKGILISMDPNFRLKLWPGKEKMLEETRIVLPFVDILKISLEEARLLTQKEELDACKEKLFSSYPNLRLIAITDGKHSSLISNCYISVFLEAFAVQAIDTTACGDAFAGALLSRLMDYDLEVEDLKEEQLKDILRFANACGALTAQRRGSMSILPTKVEIEDFLKERRCHA